MRILLWILSTVLIFGLAQFPAQAAQTDTSANSNIQVTFGANTPPETISNAIKTLKNGDGGITITILPDDANKSTENAPNSSTKKSELAENVVEQQPSPLQLIENVLSDFNAEFFSQFNAIPSTLNLPGDFINYSKRVFGDKFTAIMQQLLLAIALVLIAGNLSRWLFQKRWPFKPLRPNALFSDRFFASLPLLMGNIAALVGCWIVASIIEAKMLPSIDFLHMIYSRIIGAIYIYFLYTGIGLFLLNPNHANERLMPIAHVEYHFRMLKGFAIATGVVIYLTTITAVVSVTPRQAAGLFLILDTLISVYKITWFWNGRHDIKKLISSGANHLKRGHLIRGFFAEFSVYFYIIFAFILWFVSILFAGTPFIGKLAPALGFTQALVILTPFVAQGAVSLIASQREKYFQNKQLYPFLAAIIDTLQDVAGVVIWAVAVYFLRQVWLPVGSMATFEGPSINMRDFTTFMTALLGGLTAFMFFKHLFHALIPEVASEPSDDTPEPSTSRLSSILPLFQAVTLSTIVAVSLMMALIGLGVDVAPFIAGFGILGLAISFGSQALVKDIVSGVFFIIEDAFRAGEYIDTGRLHGVVEKISIRSVRLRQSSGLVHTVPFGQITSVTNGSRDWTTVKFRLNLDHEADIEMVRKIIKSVGQQMLEDPEYQSQFIQPVKLQGIHEITDSAIIIRVKFTVLPIQSSIIQREALKRIYQAFREAHVPLANNAPARLVAAIGAAASM